MNLEEARFGRVELVNALVGFVCDSHLDTPMTVGIYGKWGRGKTSVMRLLRGQLADEAATRNVGTSDALCHICTGTNRSAIRDLRDWRGGSDDTNALSLNDFRRIWRPRRTNIRSLFCGLANRCALTRTVGSNPTPSTIFFPP